MKNKVAIQYFSFFLSSCLFIFCSSPPPQPPLFSVQAVALFIQDWGTLLFHTRLSCLAAGANFIVPPRRRRHDIKCLNLLLQT
jgi:hypothetical protein